MVQLTMDLTLSAEMLGTEPEALLEFVEREHLEGVFKLNEDWRISIFTLAQLLNTTPQALLELLEDYALGQMIEEVEEDEYVEAQEGWLVYQADLAVTQK